MGNALAVPPALFGAPGRFAGGEEHDDAGGGGPTLDALLSGAWEGLAAHADVVCPVCTGAMDPRYGAAFAPVGGSCRDCGAALA